MNTNLEKYLELLTEIKGRTIVIGNLEIQGKKRIHDVNIEFACLQIRKILELIAFGSLVSNLEIYAQEFKKFSEFWNAELMLKDMKKLNINFFPKPLFQKEIEIEGVEHELINIDEKFYLNQQEFIRHLAKLK